MHQPRVTGSEADQFQYGNAAPCEHKAHKQDKPVRHEYPIARSCGMPDIEN